MSEVNLHSDTQTQPSVGMRAAMAEAPVGDEQRKADPTVNRLQERVAELLGTEAALFLPSGTMCNEIALKVHTQPGDEVLIDRTAHLFHFESGAPGIISGVQLTTLDGERGIFGAEQIAEAAHDPAAYGRYAPTTRMVWVENTSNLGGGTVWPLDQVEDVCREAHARGLATHMDGARLMNAVVASGTSASAYAAPFDSCWIDLTKGLGAPVGAVLAGSTDFIEQAWRYKQAFGGSMRQAGIVAAGGLYALDHNVERLAEDHANAQRLADGLDAIEGITVEHPVETNIVFFSVEGTGLDAVSWDAAMAEHGIVFEGAMGQYRMRAVTHLDVDSVAIDRAIQVAEKVRL